MVPDFTDAEKRKSTERRLVGWELITPLLNSFEQAPNGAPACMALPEPKSSLSHRGQELTAHQSRPHAADAQGQRTSLPATQPALRKTAPTQTDDQAHQHAPSP